MDEEYQIVYLDKPEWEIIVQGIRNYNQQQAGEDNAQSLCFVLSEPDQVIVGGVIGATHWDWLHLDLLWVKDELRGRGYGHRLLTLAEQEARQRGAKRVYFWIHSVFRPQTSINNMAIRFLGNYAISLPGINATFSPNNFRTRTRYDS